MGKILIIVLLCFAAGNSYIYIRALSTIRKFTFAAKAIFTILFWLSACSIFLSLALRHKDLPRFILEIMFEVGSLWLVFVLYMTLSLLAMDIVRLFVSKMQYGFLYALGITAVILIAGYVNYLHPTINRIDIPLEKQMEGGEIRVVAVSDLHLGYGTDRERLRLFVDMINAENPDIIIIGGDLIDNSLIPLYEERMDEELRRLHAPLGIYMAPGNHEYISDIKEVEAFLKKTPIKMLADSVVTLPNGIQIACRDDISNKERMHLYNLLKQADREKPLILIEHQPMNIPYKNKLGVDLLFCGHTHHGQIWPGNIITDILYEQSHGYRKWSHTHVYVSSGLSLWGPKFRIGTSCDMALFRVYSTLKEE